MRNMIKGGFTLPGEAGYENLTLELAQRWHADAIRDSDGTILSEQILQSGCDIYSTVCLIRNHNDFLQKNPQYQQQCFLMTEPVTAHTDTLSIVLLSQYRTQQFADGIMSNRPQRLWCKMLCRGILTPSIFWPYAFGKKFRCIIMSPMTGTPSI